MEDNKCYWAIQQRGQHEDWSFVSNPPFRHPKYVVAQQTCDNLTLSNADANHYIEYRVVFIDVTQ